MRRKVMVLALVALAFMLLAGPVLAAGSSRDTVLAARKVQWSGTHVISMTGTIQAIDRTPDNKRIYVTVQMTNKPYLVKRGQTVWVTMRSTTVYYYWNGTTRLSWDFGRLAVGQKVSINALVTDNKILARRVEVNKRGY